MTCKQIEETISLYHYGELPPEQEENVEAHCAGCVPCGQEVERYRHFAAAINDAGLEPSAGLLSECRERLARQVNQWERPVAKPALWRDWLRWTVDFRVPASAIPVGAMALVALGWFAGRSPSFLSPAVEASTTSLVRSVEPDASGRVTIALDEVRRRTVSGRVNDEKIRGLLLAASRDESNPGVQVECVDALKRMTASADVRAALLDAVQHDPSPGVRLKALEALKQFAADTPVRKALSAVLLNDANPGVRMQVIDLLVAHHGNAVVGVLQNQVRKEDNGHVRVRLEQALQHMNASAGTF